MIFFYKKALCFSAKCHQTNLYKSQRPLLHASAAHEKDKFPDLKINLSHVCILAFVRSTFVILLIPWLVWQDFFLFIFLSR